MKIENNKFVSLIYELREGNIEGRIVETLLEERPMTFVFGSGRLLPSFESKLASLEKGDVFSFILDAASAYGERREEMIINIPRSIFENDGKIDEEICRPGNEVPMMDSNGNRINGTIIEVADSFVRMDFNHPMAGVDLSFTGKIIEVREATEDELAPPRDTCTSCGSKTDAGCSGNCN
jgi:FKBP-type peptidyl-prolyl cis-trans isomerase SlyD